jgi:hypothetical protein
MIATVLKHRFIFNPDRLSAVIKPFAGQEHVIRLFSLVKEYLPEELERLLKLTPTDAADRFAKSFSKRYFPIATGNRHAWFEDDLIKSIDKGIPAEWYGLDSWNYEPTRNITRAQLLAETVCACPFERTYVTRVPVLAQFLKVVGEDEGRKLVKKLPEKGCTIEEVEEALKDSPYPAFLTWCRWVFGKTGNRWLDTPYGGVAWDREAVLALARDWKEYPAIDKQMKEFDTRLTGNFPAQSAKIIEYIATHRGKTLMEVFTDGNANN